MWHHHYNFVFFSLLTYISPNPIIIIPSSVSWFDKKLHLQCAIKKLKRRRCKIFFISAINVISCKLLNAWIFVQHTTLMFKYDSRQWCHNVHISRKNKLCERQSWKWDEKTVLWQWSINNNKNCDFFFNNFLLECAYPTL